MPRGFRWTTICPSWARRASRGAAADCRDQTFDVRVLPDDVGDGALILDQLGIRRALRRFGGDRDLVGVLIGDEAFRHQHEQQRRERQHHQRRHHRRRPVAQHDLQRAVVAAQQAVEPALGRLDERGTAAAIAVRFLRNSLHSIGVSVTDTTPEMRWRQIALRTSRNSRPSTPPMKSTGMNTAASIASSRRS